MLPSEATERQRLIQKRLKEQENHIITLLRHKDNETNTSKRKKLHTWKPNKSSDFFRITD